MKMFLTLAILTVSTWATTKATPSKLLHCLGAEERRFHALKETGAIYDLNQRLIAELIQVNGLEGSSHLLDTACKPMAQPSVVVLEAMLLDPKGWYVIRPLGNAVETNIAHELVKELNQSMPEMMLQFLGQLQAQAPTPDCLEKHIRGLSNLYRDIKWLQEEVDLGKIAGKKTQLTRIFEGIAQSDNYIKMCRMELRKSQEAEKSKKTTKGAGKPSAQ